MKEVESFPVPEVHSVIQDELNIIISYVFITRNFTYYSIVCNIGISCSNFTCSFYC